jgi:hypothetical protein
MNESEKTYELIGRDALIWLEKAQGLKFCALILKDQLVASIQIPPNERRVETNALFDCTLLLLGLAFENLIKGVHVARNPNLVDKKRLNRSLWQADKGHAIVEFAESLMPLSADEEDLLQRLQESIVWASRFPIPTKSSRYHNSIWPVNKRRLSTRDFEIAESLFQKLEQILMKARDANSST